MAKTAIENATRGTIFYVEPTLPTIIGLDTEHKAGEHPLFDERVAMPVDEALVRNIRRYGNRVSVVLRKNGDAFEVVDGRSRVRACREAARRAVEAGEVPPKLKVEVERGDEQTAQGIMVSLNEQRRDDGIIVKAQKAGRLMASGHSAEQVATMFGVTSQAVRQWVKLTELATPVQLAVKTGKIAATSAIKLGALPADEQVAKLAELIAEAGDKRPNGELVAAKLAAPKGEQATLPLKLTPRIAKRLLIDEEWTSGVSKDALAIVRLVAGDAKAVKDVPGLGAKMRALTKRAQP